MVSDLTPGLDGAAAADRRRPRARHQPGLDLPRPAHRARARRQQPRPRHRLRRTGAAPRHAQRPRGRDRRQPARARHRPVQRRPQRGRRPGRGARGVLLRAGARRALRPDRHEPAVRHLARDRASGWSTATRGCPATRWCEDIVRAAPDHLTERGWCQVLANWVVERYRPGTSGSPPGCARTCDALVVQRELVDPAAYVELWLKDSGHHPATGGDPAEYRRRYDTWLAWLEEQRVEAIGFGWVNLRAGGTGRHDLWDWPYDVEQPIAPAIAGWADGASTDAGARCAAGAPRGRPPGDRRPGRRRGPGGDRAPPAARLPPRPLRPTPSSPPWSVPATASCRSARSWTRSRSCSMRTRPRRARRTSRSCASWSTRGSSSRGELSRRCPPASRCPARPRCPGWCPPRA